MENVVMSTPWLKKDDRIPNSKRIRPFIGMQHPDREKRESPVQRFAYVALIE